MSPETQHHDVEPPSEHAGKTGIFLLGNTNKWSLSSGTAMEVSQYDMNQFRSQVEGEPAGVTVDHPKILEAYLLWNIKTAGEGGFRKAYLHEILNDRNMNHSVNEGFVLEAMADNILRTCQVFSTMNHRMLQSFCVNPVLRAKLDWEAVELLAKKNMSVGSVIVDGGIPQIWVDDAESSFQGLIEHTKRYPLKNIDGVDAVGDDVEPMEVVERDGVMRILSSIIRG